MATLYDFGTGTTGDGISILDVVIPDDGIVVLPTLYLTTYDIVIIKDQGTFKLHIKTGTKRNVRQRIINCIARGWYC